MLEHVIKVSPVRPQSHKVRDWLSTPWQPPVARQICVLLLRRCWLSLGEIIHRGHCHKTLLVVALVNSTLLQSPIVFMEDAGHGCKHLLTLTARGGHFQVVPFL